jgi:hypothetical protein
LHDELEWTDRLDSWKIPKIKWVEKDKMPKRVRNLPCLKSDDDDNGNPLLLIISSEGTGPCHDHSGLSDKMIAQKQRNDLDVD